MRSAMDASCSPPASPPNGPPSTSSDAHVHDDNIPVLFTRACPSEHPTTFGFYFRGQEGATQRCRSPFSAGKVGDKHSGSKQQQRREQQARRPSALSQLLRASSLGPARSERGSRGSQGLNEGEAAAGEEADTFWHNDAPFRHNGLAISCASLPIPIPIPSHKHKARWRQHGGAARVILTHASRGGCVSLFRHFPDALASYACCHVLCVDAPSL